MCFSAVASFTGGAIISSIGILSIRENKEPSNRLFAAIPFVFGIQQISEGFVWLALQSSGNDLMLIAAKNIFVITAVVIWPTMVPLSVLLMERLVKRRSIIKILLAIGIAVSLSHVVGMMIFNVNAQINGYHILYSMDSPSFLASLTSIGYVFATIPVFFISSTKKVYLFGMIIVMAYIVTQFFFSQYLISVWCFFAALASATIWWIVKEPVYQKETSFSDQADA
jgi:hypothetical protein